MYTVTPGGICISTVNSHLNPEITHKINIYGVRTWKLICKWESTVIMIFCTCFRFTCVISPLCWIQCVLWPCLVFGMGAQKWR